MVFRDIIFFLLYIVVFKSMDMRLRLYLFKQLIRISNKVISLTIEYISSLIFNKTLHQASKTELIPIFYN